MFSRIKHLEKYKIKKVFSTHAVQDFFSQRSQLLIYFHPLFWNRSLSILKVNYVYNTIIAFSLIYTASWQAIHRLQAFYIYLKKIMHLSLLSELQFSWTVDEQGKTCSDCYMTINNNCQNTYTLPFWVNSSFKDVRHLNQTKQTKALCGTYLHRLF